jgi:hypothetical protein
VMSFNDLRGYLSSLLGGWGGGGVAGRYMILIAMIPLYL